MTAEWTIIHSFIHSDETSEKELKKKINEIFVEISNTNLNWYNLDES